MEKKQTKNRRLISVLILIFVLIAAILVLAEIYNNVSAKLNEKILVSLYDKPDHYQFVAKPLKIKQFRTLTANSVI